MRIETRQVAEYEGNDRWNWSVWIEAPPEDLKKIRSVTYFLHPTFPNPERTVKDRSTKFRLDSGGWGEFTIRIRINQMDGRTEDVRHKLVLEYPGKGQRARAKARRADLGRLKVFVSSSAADFPVASAVRRALGEENIVVPEVDPDPGKPWMQQIKRSIGESDAVVALVSENPSRWVDAELDYARDIGLPVIRVDPFKGQTIVEGGEYESLAAFSSKPAAPSEVSAAIQRALERVANEISATSAPLVQPSAFIKLPEQYVADDLERLREPVIDADYSNRTGYAPEFLGSALAVPLPRVVAVDEAVTLEDGSHVIAYEHFSVVMHKKRRLALFTASNVSGDEALKRPTDDEYSRKALAGLSRSDQEKWVTDPRIPERSQIPDVFYTKDGGAFDKGHIVRREDVCWGETYEQVARANGDTFHTTNCSPQVAEFNRSSDNGIWGKLENYVKEQVDGENFSLFAGPVLSPGDRTFAGRGNRGELRIQIPSRYWKVVVGTDAGQLQAFAFVLQQDLSDVELERLRLQADQAEAGLERFEMSSYWEPYLISIPALEQTLGGALEFPEEIKRADQYKTDQGNEVLKRGAMKRI